MASGIERRWATRRRRRSDFHNRARAGILGAMNTRYPDGRYEERRVARRALSCGCPSIKARTGEHAHPQCAETIRKGDAYVHWGSINPALYSGKNFCMPCARAAGAFTV